MFDENFQSVFVLEDDFDVYAENVVAVFVLPAEIAGGGSRQTKQIMIKPRQKNFMSLICRKKILRALSFLPD